MLGVGFPTKGIHFRRYWGIRYWVSEVRVLGFGGTGVSGYGYQVSHYPNKTIK